jgi:hypothetical protein
VLPAAAANALASMAPLSVPILAVDMQTKEFVSSLSSLFSNVLPSSTRKILLAKSLFDKHFNQSWLAGFVEKQPTNALTPKLFQYMIYSKAKANKYAISSHCTTPLYSEIFDCKY